MGDFSKRRLSVGDCVCISEVEQPCAKLLVVVTKSTVELMEGRYLNAEPWLVNYDLKKQHDRVTPIESFGVEIAIRDGKYQCLQVRDSVATYADGKPRRWQDQNPSCWFSSEPKLLDLVRQRQLELKCDINTTVCPDCGKPEVSGLMASFWVPVRDSAIDGDWSDYSSNTELTSERMCRNCNFRWNEDDCCCDDTDSFCPVHNHEDTPN